MISHKKIFSKFELGIYTKLIGNSFKIARPEKLECDFKIVLNQVCTTSSACHVVVKKSIELEHYM